MSFSVTTHIATSPAEDNHIFTCANPDPIPADLPVISENDDQPGGKNNRVSIEQKSQPETDGLCEISDGTLLSEVSHGSTSALEVLYGRYARYAYALAYRIIQESSAAEDVVQDVFLSIWRKAASYKQQHGSVRSWLQAIVHHRAIDYIRASSHRDHQWIPLQAEHNHHRHYGELPDAWEEVWRKERRSLVRHILSQIPHEQRLVIELAYFEGYTHLEIAQRWRLPLGTVKGRMRLGLQRMRHLLAQHGLEISG